MMTTVNMHVTAPTQFSETNGIRFAYRRFGKETGVPLILMPHYRGGVGNRDPAPTGGVASGRPVILFVNAGVASSSGETPDTFDAMAEHAADFVKSLGLSQVDVLGFSIGGYIAQTLALIHPTLVRRLILVGTGPRAGEPSQDPGVRQRADRIPESTLEDFLYLFFSPSVSSQAAGRAFGKDAIFERPMLIRLAHVKRWTPNVLRLLNSGRCEENGSRNSSPSHNQPGRERK